MIHTKFINYFIVLIFILATTFPIQPTFAMEDENAEQPSILARDESYLSCFVTVAADLIDSLSPDLYLSASSLPLPQNYCSLTLEESNSALYVDQRDGSHFLTMPNDTTIVIFKFAYAVETDINNFKAFALTCRHWYNLLQQPIWWALLQPVYFSHLPAEYVDSLRHVHGEAGLKMCGILLHQLYGYQVEEKKRLCEMLQAHPTEQPPENKSILRNKISKEVKEGWIKKLGTLLQYDLDSLESEEKEKLRKQINSPYKRYIYMEKELNSINCEIVERCFEFIGMVDGEVRILLQRSLTRVTPDGATFIWNWLLRHDGQFNEVVVDLSHNHLRWIPDELFSIKKVTELNFMNNHLCYFPKRIGGMHDHLMVLKLGNFGPFNSVFTTPHRCRTTGNIFYRIPPAIYELVNLKELDMCSVELDEFPENEIYAAISKLKLVNIAHNNLSIVRRDQHTDEITVDSYGNPGSPSIWFHERMGDYCYDLWQKLPSWDLNVGS